MSTIRARADVRAHKARWNIYMPADRETVTFDYGIPAELFMGKRNGGARQPLRYRRFATGRRSGSPSRNFRPCARWVPGCSR